MGEKSEVVVVLGGTKGTAYHVGLEVGELLTATITPLDKVHGHPDNAKAIKVGAGPRSVASTHLVVLPLTPYHFCCHQ